MDNEDLFDFDWQDGETEATQPQSTQPQANSFSQPSHPVNQAQSNKPRQNTLPNPNNQTVKPESVNRNYEQASRSGAQVTSGQVVNRNPAYAGQPASKTQGRPQNPHPQGRPQNPHQQGSRPNPQGRPQNMQGRPHPQGRPQNMQVRQPNQQTTPPTNPPKKKGKKGLIIALVVVLGVGGFIGVKKSGLLNKEPELIEQSEDYQTSGRYAYDTLQTALNSYNAEALDEAVGLENGDSYLAQEWAYANDVALHTQFLQKVGSLVKFEYPQVHKISTTGKELDDMQESYMNNGEKATITIPDYAAIAKTMGNDRAYIEKMVKTAGYTDKDYTWTNEITLLMLQYVLDMPEIPTKTTEIALQVGLSNGVPKVITDDALDDLLFASDDFHKMCATFDQMVVGYTGKKDEVYYEDEEQHNPEYDKWLELFNKYYEEDNGEFVKGVSKWEPWYLRDKNNEFVRDKDGNLIVNYYSVKDENGKDWIEPDKTIMVSVEKHRDVDDPWVEEKTIKYSCMGTHYIQTKYSGDGETSFRVGDGSKDRPAGIGTTIITKILCEDNKYHDVRVALVGYWTSQDAIDYAEMFSTKNRGFTTVSVVQLITFEVQIENLENKPITFKNTEMSLADANSNISSRTGTLYGFSEHVTLEAGEKKIINDWASSTELEQKYVVWGKDFGRQYPMVYFDCLAGTGNIPTYSAYKAFTGQSSIDETVNITPSANTSEQSESDTQTSEQSSDTQTQTTEQSSTATTN